MTRYLADSSVWIASFSPHFPLASAQRLGDALTEDRVLTCGIVIAELLQGCRTEKQSAVLERRLQALPYLAWQETDWPLLGRTSARLRSRGITAGLPDLIVALLAHKNQATVWHRDRDFELIARHLSLSQERL